jgi:hypothetical protein
MKTSPLKTASVPFSATGIMHGVVVANNGNRLSITVPRMTGEFVHTDVECLSDGLDANYEPGEVVVVGFVEGVSDEMLVLGRIKSSMAAPGVSRNDITQSLQDQIDAIEAGLITHIDGGTP